jgi:hypothetical protein
MPEIRVKHNVAAATQPVRQVVTPAIYEALIANVVQGVATTKPPREKITIEFQIVNRFEDKDEAFKGRRVYQDFLIEPGGDDKDAREAWRLKQALAATGTVYRQEGEITIFNTDHLLGKSVKIEVKIREGKLSEADMAKPVEQRPDPQKFNRVDRIDSLTVNESDLL